MLCYRRGCAALSSDGIKVYISVKRVRMLPAVTKYVPSIAEYASKRFAKAPPKLLFGMDGGKGQVIH